MNALLLSRDLIFTSKITGTAQQLGLTVKAIADKAAAADLIRAGQARVLLLDLAARDLTGPEAVRSYRELSAPNTIFLAFGAHVDANALDAARAAGCDVVMPRSRFSAQLPALLQQYLGPGAEPQS